MAIADASLTSLRFKKETTYGVAPTSVAYNEARMISETLGQDKEAVQSEEILTDRRPPANIQVGSSGSGEIVTEAIGGGFNVAGGQPHLDEFWLASLGQAAAFPTGATAQAQTTGTITIANVGGNNDRITVTHSTVSWSGFTAGQWVSLRGLLTAAGGEDLTYLNSIYQLVSVSGAIATLTKGPRVGGGGSYTTPTLTAGTQVILRRIPDQNDSTSLISYTFERAYSIASEFALMPGYAFNGFLFEMQPKRPMRITWRLIGKEETTTAATVSSSVVAAPTAKSLSPVSDFRSFSIGEDGHSFSVTSFRLDVKGGLYLQDEKAGTLGPIGVGLGTFDITGTVEFYYEAGAVFDFYNAFNDKPMHFGAFNADANAIMFSLPNINFVGGRRSTPGKDQPIKGRLDFRASKGTDALSSTTYMLKVGRA